MHEMSIVMSIFEIIENQLKAQFGENAVRVEKVTLSVGKLSGVVPDALDFAFNIARENTMFGDAILSLKEVPVEISCNVCNITSTIDNPLFCCSSCNSTDITIKKGRELLIESIDVEEGKRL